MAELITDKALAELRAKARAHDVYLAAIARARARIPCPGLYCQGYAAALRDLSEAILDEDAKLDSRPAK